MALFHFERRVFLRVHWGVPVCMALLALIGLATIAGSEMPGAAHAPRQTVWLLVGLVAFFLAVALDPLWVRRLAPLGYTLLLMALVVLLVRGETIKGSASWYRVGPLRLQPSEFMKIAVVLVLAELGVRQAGRWRSMGGLALPILVAALPMALIFRQPDLGTAAVFAPVLFVMLLMGGARVRHLMLLGLLAVALAGVAFQHLESYQRARIFSFLQPGTDLQGRDYNIHQARITLGSGQMWGRLLGGDEEDDLSLTRTKLDFLPEPHTDFIFASLGEQAGFVGGAVVIVLYALLTAFAVTVAVGARTLHGALTVLGLLAILLTHVVLNLGMCMQLLPVTGLPLPFLSYGGSAMLTNFLIGGLICGVGARRYEFDTAPRP